MRKSILLSSILLTVSASMALAHDCSTASYDQTEPRAIRSEVSDHVGKFEWMTDVEIVNGQSWLCNCILNHDEKGWTGRWKKAGISVPIGKPVATNHESCREIFLGRHRNDPDKDAPIIYGATNVEQPAAVFASEDADENEKQGFWSFKLSSAYKNEEGSTEEFSVSGDVIRKESGLFVVRLDTTSDVYAAIDGVDRIISQPTYTQLNSASDNLFFVTNLSAWTKGSSDSNPADLSKGSSMVFTGSVGAEIKYEKSGPTPTTDLAVYVFDKDRDLLLAGEVKLPTLW